MPDAKGTAISLWHLGDAGLTPSSSTISSATSTQTMTLIFSGTPFTDTGTSSTAAHGLYVDALGVTDAEGDTNTVLNLAASKAVSDSQLPTLSAVTIASNNGNAAKAKVGDVVTVTFSASEKLNTNTVSATSTSGTTLNWKERTPTGVAEDKNWRIASDADGSNLITGVYGGRLYISSDYGVTWTERRPTGIDESKNWDGIASDADGSNLVASVSGGRLYTSSNYGVTWTERRPTGIDEGKNWCGLASDADGSNLIAGAYGGRLYTSADGGVTWTERRPSGSDVNKNWWRVASDADGSSLIVGIDALDRLYTSSDGGVTWTERRPTGIDEDKWWSQVASDADGSNLIVGVWSGRLYTSADGGVTWTERMPTGSAENKSWRIASDADGSNLIVGVYGGRLYTSADSGVSWGESAVTSTAANAPWVAVSSDYDGSNLISSVSNGRLYTSSYTHLLNNVATSTSDGGTTWIATTTVSWVDTDGAIGFDILFSDVAGNAGEGVFATTDSSSVTFDKTAPTISAVSITSNNSNVAKTSAGNIITLSFTASETLQSTSTPTVTFSSGGRAVANAAGVSNTSGNNWVASYTVAGADETGAVTFAINFSDLAGNAGTAVAGVSDLTSVAIIKVAPTYNPPSSPAPAPAPVTPVTPPVAPAVPAVVITPPPAADPNATGAFSPSSARDSTPSLQVDLGIVQSLFAGNLCVPETLIKSVSNSSVYYCGGDGLRYVFANEAVYFTWFQDFADVRVLSDADLAAIPMAHKLITHRPGIKMIKIQTDPKVYAVARGGILRWIRDEATAKLLYGNNWNTQILDVSDALFTGYTVGEPVGE